MTKAYDPETGEINPGSIFSDEPDWEDMTLDEYIIVIAGYGDQLEFVTDVLRHMPQDIRDEYADLDYPELPEELRPDYEEPPPKPEEEEE